MQLPFITGPEKITPQLRGSNTKTKEIKLCHKSIFLLLNGKSLAVTLMVRKAKVNDLHVGEWKQVLDACPKRTRLVWKDIYTQMRKRIDDINKKAEELELDHSRPLEEQDPIIRVSLVVTRKRKSADELHDYFKQDFISINDFRELNNDMLYTVQEIFHILHQGPGMDDLARTFSSLLVVEVDKRNLHPNKQTRFRNLRTSPKKEFQFSLVSNAKLNDVDLLLEAETKCFSSRRFTCQEKDML
ncbi:hypothetical protein Tco_0381372 [Tanacetum coccineum]